MFKELSTFCSKDTIHLQQRIRRTNKGKIIHLFSDLSLLQTFTTVGLFPYKSTYFTYFTYFTDLLILQCLSSLREIEKVLLAQSRDSFSWKRTFSDIHWM